MTVLQRLNISVGASEAKPLLSYLHRVNVTVHVPLSMC